MNPFPKDRILNACKAGLIWIQQERDRTIDALCLGKRTFFGRQLTRQEAFDRLPGMTILLLEASYGRQEGILKQIQSTATHCAGETINLGREEFSLLETWYT